MRNYKKIKYSWPRAVSELRKIVIENVKFALPAEAANFKLEMLQTDTFHPFDSDAEHLLSRALGNYPASCNYRSCESYWLNKDSKQELAEALRVWFEETNSRMDEYYGDAWNFAPGYTKPTYVCSDWDTIADKVTARVLRAAKKK
jgi:hypothetical protein